ncbi:hypothetical protein FHX42_005313 [Saccharopolyspora lacisalsi]|uniref:Uncharacterized protein n=1 Tax=Halosaccharopolyspora lacisalsi TaxID=1000566 RepID=A0A839E5J9_9PSEU|nr:hypothetical protein [Halosaccharopolyspora lacisalsi]MBA8827906.1 hypothetical protein [Halosaccharopolyspora lacisalsi]
MTTPDPPAAATTLVKNQLLHPDGTAQKGIQVDLIARSNTAWTADGTGRIVGQVRTWTGPRGCWRQALLPYSAYLASEYVYVEVWESGRLTGAIRVPPKPAGVECWVWDLLVNPPPAPDGNGWQPVSELGDLRNVATAANRPADGSALLATGGVWRPEPVSTIGQELELEDVGNVAPTQARPGQVLTAAAGDTAGTITWRALNLPDPHTPSKLTELADAAGLATATEGQFVTAHITGRGVLTWIPADPPAPPEHLADLGDVAATAPSVGQRLTWNGSEWTPADVPTPAVPALGELPDVDTTGAASGQPLEYDGTTWQPGTYPEPPGPPALDELPDVDTTGVTAGQVLTAAAGSTPGELVWRSLALPDPHTPSKLTELADAAGLSTATEGQFVTAHVDSDGALTWIPTAGPTVPHVANDLADVQSATPSEHGRVLMDNGTYWTAGRPELSDASDVATRTPKTGQHLAYDGTEWAPVDPPAVPEVPSELSDLSDVASAAPTGGQVLTWDTAGATWKPAAVPTPSPAPATVPVGFPASAYGLQAASCHPGEGSSVYQVYNTGAAVRMVVPAGVPVTGVVWWVSEAFSGSNRSDCGVAVYVASGANTATNPRATDTDGYTSVFASTGAKTSMLNTAIPAKSAPWEAYVVINYCYSGIGRIAAQSWPSNSSLQYHAVTSGYVRVGKYINWQINASATWSNTVTVEPAGKADPTMPYIGLI